MGRGEEEQGFFFFKPKTAYDIRLSLVGSKMCIGDGLFLSRMGYFCHQAANSQYSHTPSESDRLKMEDSEDRLPQTIHQFGSQRSTEVTRGAYESPECPLQLAGS